MFNIFLDRRRRPVLADSGATFSCISYEYFVNNPYLKKYFTPRKTHGTAINGSDVESIGDVKLQFNINGTPMMATCRVIKGLMDEVILGWDWMCRHKITLDAANGKLHYLEGGCVSLIKNERPSAGCLYRVSEDLIIPPNSKVHTDVELVLDAASSRKMTDSVVTDPFTNNGGNFWAARTCSKVRGNQFMTEFCNPTNNSIKVEAGQAIGFAEFIKEDKFNAVTHQTEMTCSYGDDSGYESNADSSGEDDPSDGEDDPPKECDPTPGFGSCRTTTTADEGPEPEEEIPPGAKPLNLDYSELAKEAKPYTEQLKHLFEVKHKKAFSRHDRDYGKTTLVQYRAHMKDPDQTPLAQPAYRTRPEMQEIIHGQAQQMIADGLVGHSTSPYSAPILLSRKKCGGWRFLTDFRRVNERCDKVVHPLPRIEDSIQRLESPSFFSSMDLTKGFWQIPVHPDDRKFFAFSTESLHLEYLVAPMGAKNSPSYLSALMQLVLRGLPIQHVISYLDDILVADTNMEDHLKHLDLVLSALIKAGLKLNPSKCSFARESVVCLGHKLSREGVSPDPANIKKVKSWKAPTDAKKLRAFLGLTGYYRQFVEGYSNIAGCLTDLTRDDVKWHWKDEHQQAFETLRDTLTSDAVMSYPDFTQPFIVKTDASLSAIGYVLTQKVGGKERVISYGSKKLSQPQRNWSTYDREFFAMIAGIRANAHYLRHAKFSVVTDHRPLLAWRRVDSKKDPTGRRTRWAIELDSYEFDLLYKKGSTHTDADAMSRRGDDDDEVADDPDDFCLGHWEELPGGPTSETLDLVLTGMENDDEYPAVKFNALDDSCKRLKRKQDADPIISEVKSHVKKRRNLPHEFPCNWFKRNYKWLTTQDGILYRRSYAESVHGQILQAIIPEELVPEVLEELHGSEFSGHPSENKMLLKVRRYAIWPTMPKDVKTKVTNCMVCDQLKEQVPRPVTPLQPIVATRVFQHVMCDLIAMPVPSFGYKHVLIFKDVFSGFIRCYKLRDKTTNGVVKAFEDLVCSLGPPTLLSSDNGGEFISDALKHACRSIGVEKRTSVPYRPQSQGNVERQNRTLLKDLQHRLVQYGKTWVEHLPYTEWIHNTTPFSKTGMAPYFLFFGREPLLPRFANVPVEEKKDVKSSVFLEQMKERMQDIVKEANTRAEEKRQKEADSYNKRTKHQPFEAGDQVWEREEVRNKLQPKWSGPVTIVSRNSSAAGDPGTTYRCERKDGSTSRRNYEQLKRVNARYEENMRTPVEAKEPREPKRPKQLDSLSILTAIMAPRPDAPAAEEPTAETPASPGDPLPRPAPVWVATSAPSAAPAATPATAASTTMPAAPLPTGPTRTSASEPTGPIPRPPPPPPPLQRRLVPVLKLSTKSPSTKSLNTKRQTPVAPPAHTVEATEMVTGNPSGEVVEQNPHVASTSGAGNLADNAGDNSAQSLQSTTEFDVAFLGDSRQSSLNENQISPRERKGQRLSPKTPGFVSAPSSPARNPPRHPIVDSITIDSSPEYKSPIWGSPPDQIIATRNRRNRIPIDQLVLSMEALADAADGKEADSSDGMTPTPQPASCPAYEAFAPDEDLYLANAPTGSVRIKRVKETDTPAYGLEPVGQAEQSANQPSTSSGLRTLQTKAKTKDQRKRTAASGAAYPQSIVDRAKVARNRRQDDDDDQPTKPRAKDGRFTKS